MNNFLLFIGFLILFLFVLKYNKNSITSPSVLFTGGFLVSSLFFYVNTPIWGYVISSGTVYFLLLGNVLFILGCMVKGKPQLGSLKYRSNGFNSLMSINDKISDSVFIAMLLVEMVGIWMRFRVLLYILGTMSIANQELGELRGSQISTPYDTPIKIFFSIITVIVIYAIIVFLKRLKNHKGISAKSIILMIGYFVFCMVSSSRIDILYLFLFIFVFYFVIYKNDSLKNLSIKSIIKVVPFVAAFFIVFFLLGYLTGKAQKQESFFDNISMYTGASIGAFDSYCKTFQYTTDYLFSTSFQGLKTMLGYIGIQLSTYKDEFFGSNFVVLGNMTHTTNVYTCYYNIVHDFDKLGALIIIFAEGYTYQLIYSKARKDLATGNNTWFIFYVIIVPYIFLSSIADRFFGAFLTITSIVTFIIIKLFKKLNWI